MVVLCVCVCVCAQPAASTTKTQQQKQPQQGGRAEDDGWLLVSYHDAATGKGSLAILEAADVAAGPVATIRCPHFLPAGLHGSFSPTVFRERNDAEPAWREPGQVHALD